MEIRKEKKALDKIYRRRDRYDLQPDFQRDPVWGLPRQQKLMDTILKKWDIPKIYLRVVEDENFECIDGQQRLTTIFKFYNNEIPLQVGGEYSWLFYNDLPDKIKDIFDDYELDIALVYNATDEELRELFSRLQLWMSLNSAEKLNAMSWKMRDFIKDLAQHKFFIEKTSIQNKRFAFLAIVSQICLLELEGIKNAKFKDLEDLYKKNKKFNKESKEAKKIQKTLDILDLIFEEKTFAFRNRASVVSFFMLISYLVDKKIDIIKYKGQLKIFYTEFQRKLKLEIEKWSEAKDPELLMYQSKVNQAADSKDSILRRDEILKKQLVEFDSSFKDIVTDKQFEAITLDKVNNIKQISEQIIKKITEVNKIYSSKNKEDLFKPTNSLLESTNIIGLPVDSKDSFKDLIDALYKIFYEWSWNLTRIHENIKNDSSVFFDIKHLRTDCFHDYEHGEQKKIDQKRNIISWVYTKYSQKKSLVEINETDLIHFQKKILTVINNELMNIEETISG